MKGGATAADASTSVRTCACGCGQATKFGQIEALALAGQTRKEIAASLGLSYSQVRVALKTAPRFLVGHNWVPGVRLRMKAASVEQTRWEWTRESGRWERVRAGSRASYASMLRAFDLRSLAPYLGPTEAQAQKAATRVRRQLHEQRLALQWERRTARAVAGELGRMAREIEREQIDHLRSLVGMGWHQDSEPRDYHLVHLEDLALSRINGEVGGMDWLDVLAEREDERQRLEREWAAAALVIESPPLRSLARIALTAPQNLTAGERDALRIHYERALEGDALVRQHRARDGTDPDKSPEGQAARRQLEKSLWWRLKMAGERAGANGPGQGSAARRSSGHRRRHADPHTVGQKRFEGKDQITQDRAMREAARR